MMNWLPLQGSAPSDEVAPPQAPDQPPAAPLHEVARLDAAKVQRGSAPLWGGHPGAPVLVLLAAGMGKRFGTDPKCVQLVDSKPIARHSVDAFHSLQANGVIAVTGYRAEDVMQAIGADVTYVRSDNPTGGTAFAAFEVFSVPELLERNPLLMIGMGDRITTPRILRRLVERHLEGQQEASLTFLTAIYEQSRRKGKGRIVRDADGHVSRIVEQRDIDALEDKERRDSLDAIREGNCPLYLIRAQLLYQHLRDLTNRNAQGQYYLTDIIQDLRAAGADIRTITITHADPDYDVLLCDVTRPDDLGHMEKALAGSRARPAVDNGDVVRALEAITADRPAGQVAAIAAQLSELRSEALHAGLGFRPDLPVGIGVAGGRLRIAFMHPDMGRFYGPAWQMSIGARDAAGREQIVLLYQASDDHQLHVFPLNPAFREQANSVAAGRESMYPGSQVDDWYGYEGFGTKMAADLLSSLGYVTDRELQDLRRRGEPQPPPSQWVSANMRRPFSLVANALASMRTRRRGPEGEAIQEALGRGSFLGARLVCSGAIPRGGFSSSSAVTLAVQNAANAYYSLGLSDDTLVDLACQAEYGTGVRAGSLDQATEQKGRPGCGTLISSNPRDHYRVIGIYPVPAHRFRVIFPYSADRDREAWRWSAGVYAAEPGGARLTTGEVRKMTGKAAELAAVLLRLPLSVDFFREIEEDLVDDGVLELENRLKVYGYLRQLPLLISVPDLQHRIQSNLEWYAGQLAGAHGLSLEAARLRAQATFESLFDGWREPLLRRTTDEGEVIRERGVPLRAMVAYLYGEVAKNLYLVNHPEQWIRCVSASQKGDRCFDVDPLRLPDRGAMEGRLPWEAGLSGPELMEAWLQHAGATPFNYNAGLDDETLTRWLHELGEAMDGTRPDPVYTHLNLMEGTSFFRGLALLDLVEAMLKRAFGDDAVAVRVNAAGQGDFYQVHVDTLKADPADVQEFIRRAVYRRFGLAPEQEFVETHPGGGAVGVRLQRFDHLPELIELLESAAAGGE